MKRIEFVEVLFLSGLLCGLFVLPCVAASGPVLSLDFKDPAICAKWGQPHDIAALRPTAEGLEIAINGEDPYFFGPPLGLPSSPLWLELKLRSETGGSGQVFYFTGNATEENSVHFGMPAGEWKTVRLALPPLGKNYRIRIDPPGSSGRCVIASATFLVQPDWSMPQLVAPVPLSVTQRPWLMNSEICVRLTPEAWGGFEVTPPSSSASFRTAIPHSGLRLAYVLNDKVVWFDPASPATKRRSAIIDGKGSREIISSLTCNDPDGAQWTLEQVFNRPNGIFSGQIEITVSVNQDRDVLFLPLLFLIWDPGDTNKQQAIFPGLEYLDNEPSSSEADLIGPASKRQVPDPLKITQPYFAFLASNRWFSLEWEPNPKLSAFFESPDRTFNSSAHVFGLMFPGFGGYTRTDGHWLPNEPVRLKAGEKLTARVFVQSGQGRSLQPAIENYVKRHGFPEMPTSTPSWREYFDTAAGGWLNSKAREGNLVRHAVWQGFPPGQAADAAAYLEWLAANTDDPATIATLTNTAAQILSAVPPANWAGAEVSHIRMPWPPLVFGHIAENQRQARVHAEHLVQRFSQDGFVAYAAVPGKTDYTKTYHTNHANGLTAQVTMTYLEAAAFCGDAKLIQDALQKVRALKTLYHDGVPRGAQTWEVPLHTPDILASAHLVRANALAWQLTGDKDFLDQAHYWAWTGVPFVYLINPAEKPIGTYTTIAVLGATGWRAPVWMGLPVQWCGLVYADALYRLGGEALPGVPWKKLADGITAAGIQVSWPLSDKDRQGLLPDSFLLREQKRDGPAINPGTVQPCAARFYNKLPVYDCQVIRSAPETYIIHAPGSILLQKPQGTAKGAFTAQLWPRHPAWILINGVNHLPKIKLNDESITIQGPHEYDASLGSLRLLVQGTVKVEID